MLIFVLVFSKVVVSFNKPIKVLSNRSLKKLKRKLGIYEKLKIGLNSLPFLYQLIFYLKKLRIRLSELSSGELDIK